MGLNLKYEDYLYSLATRHGSIEEFAKWAIIFLVFKMISLAVILFIILSRKKKKN